MFKRIDHVEIVTDQPERTVAFYTEILGFTVKQRDRIERSGLGVPIDLVYLDLGGTVVELITYDGATVDPAPRNEHLGYRMIALEVEDMDRAAAYLKTKGVDIVWGPRIAPAYARRDPRPQRLPHRTAPVVPLTKASAAVRAGHGIAARYSGQGAATSSVHTEKLLSVFGPKVVLIATSAASRPRAINTRPMRGMLLRASNVYHRPPR